ncbi:outer membrane protein assembly factor BamB family protein [Allorhodopirellula solitaria]|uniref:Quinohemoprotein alcohol dehydrogenase ADH-IIG n=1 Tax=Allorhodopirellula solitaria TaxID=2527987 RepID=A0A5C5X1R8_9BACT|nr:PQQ-binding-like beta-propeller repeat protein [Allorhodopirellula solitaria]TWT56105.1 Quinohemoprotein alcohol dehydrogenase ADH-IIG precursor [Allorhodopirellula solitaria]
MTPPLRPRHLAILAGVALLGLGLSTSQAEDWPQWRGENRDGAIAMDVPLMESLPQGQLPLLWSVPIGAGYSAPTVVGNRVYVMDRQSENERDSRERVLCLDTETGKTVWTHQYNAPYTIQYTAGPRAAVTIHQGRALSVGAMGHLHCFDAATGEVLWAHDIETEYEARLPIWGIAGAPLVVDDLVIQIAAGSDGACVLAFDLETGKERWRSLDEPAGYSAPILIHQGDQDVVVCWTGASVSGLDPQTGEVFWRVAMPSRNMPIGVPTPVTDGEHLFVTSFYDGSMLIELDPSKPDATQQWHRVGVDERNTDALQSIISTPIMKGEHIYGVDSYGELRCLKMSNGDRVWEDLTAVPRNRWGTIHIMQHGDDEIMLNDQGELIFATLSPQGFDEHSRTQLLSPTRRQLPRRNGVTWSHPAVADGYIYARNDKELVRASLRKQDGPAGGE